MAKGGSGWLRRAQKGSEGLRRAQKGSEGLRRAHKGSRLDVILLKMLEFPLHSKLRSYSKEKCVRQFLKIFCVVCTEKSL